MPKVFVLQPVIQEYTETKKEHRNALFKNDWKSL